MQSVTIISSELLIQIQETQSKILEMLKEKGIEDNKEELMSVRQASIFTKFSEQKIRAMLKKGEIEFQRFGKSIRIPKANLLNLEKK